MVEQRVFKLTASTAQRKNEIRDVLIPYVHVVDETERTLTVSPVYERDFEMLLEVATQIEDTGVFGREVF